MDETRRRAIEDVRHTRSYIRSLGQHMMETDDEEYRSSLGNDIIDAEERIRTLVREHGLSETETAELD